MDSLRQQKVNSLLLRELATIFQQESRNLFKGALIGITVVRVSPDMGHARVYVSIFKPNTPSSEIMAEVVYHTSAIRGFLGKRLGKNLRIIPELNFFLDDSFDYAEKIDEALKK